MEDGYKIIIERLDVLEKEIPKKVLRDAQIVQRKLYTQLESLHWLSHRLKIKGNLPPLRAWATSPDVLVKLHAYVMSAKPNIIVEFGSGASTLVIADALRQNGKGKLISIEHSDFYGRQTLGTLESDHLQDWVDLRVGALEPWDGEHLNPTDPKRPSEWYPVSLLEDISDVELLWVDGPPGATCLYSRYPALPALADKLAPHAEIWMDDTVRQEEIDTCEHWAKNYGFDLEFYPLEKGLGCLTRAAAKKNETKNYYSVSDIIESHPERAIGLDFSLPEKRYKG